MMYIISVEYQMGKPLDVCYIDQQFDGGSF
jgi:hypothetical protein